MKCGGSQFGKSTPKGALLKETSGTLPVAEYCNKHYMRIFQLTDRITFQLLKGACDHGIFEKFECYRGCKNNGLMWLRCDMLRT